MLPVLFVMTFRMNGAQWGPQTPKEADGLVRGKRHEQGRLSVPEACICIGMLRWCWAIENENPA